MWVDCVYFCIPSLRLSAVIRILCTLKGSQCSTIGRSEIETLVQRCLEELEKRSLDGEDEKLQLRKSGLIGVKFDNDIVLYFKSKKYNDLINLKKVFDNGEINSISKSDFRMFLPGDDQHFTAMLEWSREDSKRCGDYYLCCRSFSDTCVSNVYSIHRTLMLTSKQRFSCIFICFFTINLTFCGDIGGRLLSLSPLQKYFRNITL